MCLSSAYRGSADENNLLLSNVMQVDCAGDTITLTDIMQRQIVIDGKIVSMNLMDNKIVIAPTES